MNLEELKKRRDEAKHDLDELESLIFEQLKEQTVDDSGASYTDLSRRWLAMHLEDLEHQLRLERSRVDKRADELVAFLNIQHDQQTVSDTQLSLAETQFMLLETYYVLINQRIKNLKRK